MLVRHKKAAFLQLFIIKFTLMGKISEKSANSPGLVKLALSPIYYTFR